MEIFLNRQYVKAALGAEDTNFVSCSSVVHSAMNGDLMKNFAVGIPAFLEDEIKLLLYAGEYDLICNWLGKNLFFLKSVESVDKLLELEFDLLTYFTILP